MSSQSNDLQANTRSLLNQQGHLNTTTSKLRKQQDPYQQRQYEKPKAVNTHKLTPHKNTLNNLNTYSNPQTYQLSNQDQTQVEQDFGKLQLPKMDDNQKILFFHFNNQLQKIQAKQSKLKKQSRGILCKVTFIVTLIALFFIVLLKTFLFFSNQFIGTVIQSFKEQLFDPHITNDELQLQIFYIEEACFILTTILLFFFIIFCVVMVNKFYMKKIHIYRRNTRVLNQLDSRKNKLAKQLQSINPLNLF